MGDNMKCLCCYTGSEDIAGFIFGDNEFFICNDCLKPVRDDAIDEHCHVNQAGGHTPPTSLTNQ